MLDVMIAMFLPECLHDLCLTGNQHNRSGVCENFFHVLKNPKIQVCLSDNLLLQAAGFGDLEHVIDRTPMARKAAEIGFELLDELLHVKWHRVPEPDNANYIGLQDG